MRSTRLTLWGVLAGMASVCAAAMLRPNGYDWNREYLSTLLRGDSVPARILAIAGMALFCACIAVIFNRLAHSSGTSTLSKIIRIAGVGSMVYAVLAATPLHDLVVTISLAFFAVAILALLRALYLKRMTAFLVTGSLCFLLLAASAASYYTGAGLAALPWAQRILFAAFAAWLIALDLGAPRLRIQGA
jgi:hypothetical protein